MKKIIENINSLIVYVDWGFLRSQDIVSSSAKFVFLVLTISSLKEIAAENKQHLSFQLNQMYFL